MKVVINYDFQTMQQMQFIVNFCPENEDDQEASIVVVTEREKFEVPVICHGARGTTELCLEKILIIIKINKH